MSTAQQTFRSALWNHIGKILEYVMTYGAAVLIARTLGVEENGKFVSVVSLSHLLFVLGSFGLETSLNKHIPQLRDDRFSHRVRYLIRKVLLIRVGAFSAGVLLLVGLSSIPSLRLLPYFQEYLLVLLGYAGVRGIVPLLAMVLVAQLRTGLNAKINLLTRAVEFAGVAYLATLNATVSQFLLMFVAAGLLQVGLYGLLSGKDFLGESERLDLRPVLAFGGIYWMNSISEFLTGRQSDILLLSNLLTDTSQASLYDVAFSVAQLAAMGTTIGLAGVSLAAFARLAISSPEVMDRFYGFNIRIVSLLTVPLYAYLLFHAEWVVELIYSPNFAQAAFFIQWIVAFRIVSRLFGGHENAEFLLAKGEVGKLVWVGVGAGILNVGLNVLLIPGMGAMGAVVASGSANLLANLAGGLLVFRISTNHVQLLYWIKVSAACCIASFACAHLPLEGNLAVLGIYALAVVLLMFWVKPLTVGDHGWLSQASRALGEALKPFTAFDRTDPLGTARS